MRYIKQGIARNGVGTIVPDATISVYLAGTTTAASIYAASSGGTAVNSVTSGDDGGFTFYVSRTDYEWDQLFKVVISKTGHDPSTWDYVSIFPYDYDPYYVDALLSYGDGTAFTKSTIDSALTAIGTTNKTTLLLRPGTWVIGANADWSAYTNVTFKIVPGAIISYGAYTLNIPNPSIPFGIFQWLSGTGRVTFSGNVSEIPPEWYGAIAGGSVDCAPAINQAGLSATSAAGSVYKARTVKFLGGVYLAKSTLIFQPFVNYVGVRGATANSSLPYTTVTDSHGTVIRQHTDIYNNDNSSAGVLTYISSGDLTIENILFVGTGTLTANPSVGIQFGSSSTSRTHETIDNNVSGLTLINTRFVGFLIGWEIYNINDSFAYGYGFESNSNSIYIPGRTSGAVMGTLEMYGGVIFASQNGLVIGDNANIDLHFIGGLFEGSAAGAQYHISKTTGTLPQTVDGYAPSFRFTGTRFRHVPTETSSLHLYINAIWDGFTGYFQFDNCVFENGAPGSGIYLGASSGTLGPHNVYVNNPYFKNSGVSLLAPSSNIKLAGGEFENSYITAAGITKSDIKDNYFRDATGAAVTAITVSGASSDVSIIGNSGDATITDLISAPSGIYRSNNRGDADSDGDWTAAFTCGTSGTITIDNAYKTGRFIRNGKTVTITGLFSAASVSSPVGVLNITGLPFAASAGNKHYAAVSVLVDGLTSDATNPHYQGLISPGGTSIAISKINAGSITALAGDIKAGSYIGISVTYLAD